MSASSSRSRPRLRSAKDIQAAPEAKSATPRQIRIAAAQYPLEFVKDWRTFERKIEGWVEEAAAGGANLLVFPEYASLELAATFAPEVYSSLSLQLNALQSLVPEFRLLFARLAMQHRCFILAPSFPMRDTLVAGGVSAPAGASSTRPARYVNRAWFFGPDGSFEAQDKHHMTRYEDEIWGISSGDDLTVFSTPLAEVGVNICYDVEFPMMARAQTGAGATLLLVPSCTETLAGYHRVRIGAQARALENQCFVVHAVTIGEADWSPALERGVGKAAVYVPPDGGFPDNGVLVQGELNQPGWIFADLNLDMLAEVRTNGQVLNFRDWHRDEE